MIGGNIKAILQVSTTTKNEIGEKVPAWHDVPVTMPGKREPGLFGFLDLSGETTNRTTYNAKIQESTHIFICDYVAIPATLDVDGKTVKVSVENARMVANSQRYDVMLIDNPMGLNKHLEIYLKFTGGQ